MGKIKLDLLNDRFYRPGDVVEPRIYDSTEEMVWKAPERDSRDTQIPFLMKPKIIRSSYSDWRTGKIKLESGDAPLIDNKGRNFVFGTELKGVNFSERKLRSFDFGENEAARTFYCKPERMDCPAMNKVLDGLHDVPGETIKDRVKMGKVEGPQWTDVPRWMKEYSNTADIGPGHYDIHRYNDKFGPTHSNLLRLSEVESGRGEDEFMKKSSAMRRQERNLKILADANPNYKPRIVEESGILEAKSTLDANFKIDLGAGSKRFVTRVEPYVKTQGGKLPIDFDPHLDRTRLPVSFSQSSKFLKEERPLTLDTDYTVNYGKKADIVTAAIQSPIKFSAAFKSNAPIGLVIKEPTSGINAAIFEGLPGAIDIRDPTRKNATFLQKRGSCFDGIKPTPGTHEGYKKFTDTNHAGPTFPKGSSGAANVQKEKTLRQINEVYPRLATKLWPPPPKVEKKDPFAYLKPKIK
jgi:hypothetical protein